MPICPFCRKPVTSPYAVWCGCGTNLTKYYTLPSTLDEIKPWLEKNSPEILKAEAMKDTLLNQAQQSLIIEQEAAIKKNNQNSLEVNQVRQVFQDFLASCNQENLAPNSDIGKLRRERYRQQKKSGLTVNMPVHNFKPTPAYFFTISFGKIAEDFNLITNGELYRHHISARDPFPIEDLLKIAPQEKIIEGLRQALVTLLKLKQIPTPEAQKKFKKKVKKTKETKKAEEKK